MGAVAAFALTIRPVELGGASTPGLGLIVAGPLAVVIGGFGAIAVAGIWSQIFPGLREQKTLDHRMVADGIAEPSAAQ